MSETFLMNSVCGLIFAFVSAQPMIVIGVTGPILVFEESLYKVIYRVQQNQVFLIISVFNFHRSALQSPSNKVNIDYFKLYADLPEFGSGILGISFLGWHLVGCNSYCSCGHRRKYPGQICQQIYPRYIRPSYFTHLYL